MIVSSQALFLLTCLGTSVNAFIPPVLPRSSPSFVLPNTLNDDPVTTTSSSSTTALNAKGKTKKKKKTRSTAATSGGFGKTAVVTKSKKGSDGANSDYEAFPPLEDGVKETLLPSLSSSDVYGEDLPGEILDRLAQIYGFDNFNYPVSNAADDDSKGEDALSFDDLLSTDNSKSSSSSQLDDLLNPSSSTSGGSTNDLSDLIASATGGGETTSTSAPMQQQDDEINELSTLPPFSKIRVLHLDPMILAIDDFFTSDECDQYVDLCAKPKKRTSNNDMPMMSRSKTMGKDSLAKAQRTSTTWYHHFNTVPELMAKASRLLGLNGISRWEEPQTVRYQSTEKFTWHLDALAPSESTSDLGGQRVATVLVYLTDIGENNGGATVFRDLGSSDEEKYLRVVPKKGTALLFFPSAGGIPNSPFDIRTLHAGEALSEDATADKWIAQLWLRENGNYKPTGPPGNSHTDATEAITEFCSQ